VVKNLEVYNNSNKKIDKRVIHKLVNGLKKDLGFDISSLQIDFITPDQILTINKDYLGHNYSTDIITFNYSGNHKFLDGELIISVNDAETNSKIYSVTFDEEVWRLVIHGILHLLNFDDKKERDRRIMKRMENKLLKVHKFALLD
jgi:rRNA maturation RNase YbeY